MPEIVVTGEDSGPEAVELESVHAAAVAEGAAAVHEQTAQAAAGEAELAAAVAAGAASGVAEEALSAAESADVAGQAAQMALDAERRIADALDGHTAAITSLVEVLRSTTTQNASPPVPEKKTPAPAADREPAGRKRTFGERYYGKRG